MIITIITIIITLMIIVLASLYYWCKSPIIEEYDSNVPGPKIVILSGTHGNELAPHYAAVDYFNNHNIKKGSERHGRGLVFSISQDGINTGYMYCFKGTTCTIEESRSKNHCQTQAKKKGRENVKCNTFAKGRKIVWNNI